MDEKIERVLSGALWNEFCDRLKSAGETILRPSTPATVFDRAEGIRYLTRLLRAGLEPALDPRRGLDHGAWAPLHLAYPVADIPTLQLSIQSDLPAAHHLRLGEALRPLRDEGVLILGSGSATHNLQAFRQSRLQLDSPTPPWAAAFADWLAGAVARGDRAALLDWQAAPQALENHPSPEHFLPFFVALGAGTPGLAGRALHRSWTYGVLAMDAYAFD